MEARCVCNESEVKGNDISNECGENGPASCCVPAVGANDLVFSSGILRKRLLPLAMQGLVAGVLAVAGVLTQVLRILDQNFYKEY